MLAILISCLGVYGLVLFIVQRKVKEIGLRKVLGSSVADILFMIFKDFMRLLFFFGFLLAVTVSYYLLNNWLQNFTYHTNLDVVTFLISFLVLLGITLLTVSYQAIRASLANPISSLRSK
jgi:putative ABC transport system permease protein